MLSLFMMRKFLIIPVLIAGFLSVQMKAHAQSPVVCIDAGHGGSDIGTAYQALTEKQETLDIATRLNNMLQQAGVSTKMTRTTDTTLSNAQRRDICNSSGSTLLVSVHLNGSTNHNTDYTEVLYGKRNKDLAWASALDSAMANLSSALGTGTIQNNGVTNFADGLLLKVSYPAVISETVFLTSDAEYSLLNDGTGNRQQAIAAQLYNGVQSWLATH